MKSLFVAIILSFTIGTQYSHSNTSKIGTIKISSDDPYEKICYVFVGKPNKSKVQPLLEAVMKKHNLAVNNENIMKAASCLLTLRKKSTIGITEMEILKHMYQKGTSKLTFPDQAAISSVLLEKSK